MTASNARRISVLIGALWACVALLSCQAPPHGDDDAQPAAPEPPAWSQFINSWNDRVEKLQQFYSRGVIELRWEDDDGRHFEQGDVDLWVSLPRRTALRISKAGDVLAWLGSNDSEYWLFDLLEEPTQLIVAPHDEPVSINMAGLRLDSQTLLDVLALSKLPDTGSIAFDADSGKWIAETQRAGGLLRIAVDPESALPRRIEAIDPNGATQLTSELGRYERVETRGKSSLAWPKLPTRIVLTAPESTMDGRTGDARLYLSRPTAVVDDQPMDRVFDLDLLMQSLQPDDIRRLRDNAHSHTSSAD